ncbi:phage holin family protein [Alkaliphilus serpentinus]|uniref:Phage holin family protein n=1 Tax=Alkaliphilus serpentinus TaxID=1482731 RepID=A0A833HQ36_9FIRM|nr:phage holin family protein [Alkaliphilus serpentinus]KAB3531484.1 phage holin family protein [Alkaliphilus serpentinus]
MRKLILRLAVSALSIYIIAYLMEGIHVNSIEATIIAAVVLGIANTLVKPILIILTLPINIMTLGLFTFIINGGFLKMTASIVEGFTVEGYFDAIIGAILLSIANMVLGSLTGVKK